MNNTTIILDIIYLIGSVTFILGLKMMGKPDTARKGNLYAAFGMTLAIFGTIFLHNGPIGPIIGWMVAKKVKMTAMPQLVSLFNGMGGACAALISIMEFHVHAGDPKT